MEVQLELPITLDAAGGISEVFIDQKPGWQSSYLYSIETPDGIKKIDQNYMFQIISIQTEWERERLKWQILNEVKLHPTIKQNLLHNLKERSLPQLVSVAPSSYRS